MRAGGGVKKLSQTNEGGGQGLYLCLESSLSLTNRARSRTKAEHVGHAQHFPPSPWAAATALQWSGLQFPLRVNRLSGA